MRASLAKPRPRAYIQDGLERAAMSTTNRIFDEFARVVTDATGMAQGVRREIETVVRGQVELFLRDMEVAAGEGVGVLRDMVVSVRADNGALAARLAKLEGGGPTVVPLRETGSPGATPPGN